MTKEDSMAQNLKLLGDTTSKLRRIQHELISHGVSNDSLETVSQLLDQCVQLVNREVSNERKLKHFDFKIAKQSPKDILPFSPITGPYNAVAPDIDIHFIKETGTIEAKVTYDRRFEGPPGMVHGGTISAIFDQLLAMCATCNEQAGPTATLSIDYLAPTPLNKPLVFTCSIGKIEGKKITVTGQCYNDETLVTQATGLFIQYKP